MNPMDCHDMYIVFLAQWFLPVITLLTVGYDRCHHNWQCHLHPSQRWHSDTNQWWHCDSSQWRQCHCVISTRHKWCDIAWGRHQQWQTSTTDTNIVRLESLRQCQLTRIAMAKCQHFIVTLTVCEHCGAILSLAICEQTWVIWEVPIGVT